MIGQIPAWSKILLCNFFTRLGPRFFSLGWKWSRFYFSIPKFIWFFPSKKKFERHGGKARKEGNWTGLRNESSHQIAKLSRGLAKQSKARQGKAKGGDPSLGGFQRDEGVDKDKTQRLPPFVMDSRSNEWTNGQWEVDVINFSSEMNSENSRLSKNSKV